MVLKNKIKNNTAKFLLRLSQVKIFNKWIIFTTDLILFTLASLSSLIIYHFFSPNKVVDSFSVFTYIFCSFLISATIFLLLKSYKGVIRHSSFEEVIRIFLIAFLKIVFLLSVLFFLKQKFSLAFIFILFQDWLFSILFLISMRSVLMVVYHKLLFVVHKPQRVLILGTGNESISAAKEGLNKKKYIAVGFLTHGDSLNNFRIAGLPVIKIKSSKESFAQLAKKHDVSTLLFPSYDLVRTEKNELVEACIKNNIAMLVAQPIKEMRNSLDAQPSVREIEIEDLLGRDEIEINLKEIKDTLQNKVILVTGAAGSIGSEIVRQLAALHVKKLVLFDNGESALHSIRLELEHFYPELEFKAIIGDIRNEDRLSFVFRTHNPQVVFHAAAYKHVPLMEENPCEAVQVNIKGTKSLADKSIEFGVEKFITISTDKAVNPTNVMGASKRIAEIYTQSLSTAIKGGQLNSSTEFITTRFGNVLGSNGSVIPFFKKQIKEGGPVTVTHPDIIRYFMTIPEACRLVLEAAVLGKGGEIFLFDMGEPVKIDSLARKMISLAGYIPDEDIAIIYTGLRPGEKLYEELLNDAESTLPTQNKKIRVAQVREHNLKEVEDDLDILHSLSSKGEVIMTVTQMKRMVPEFISKNSAFEELDKVEKVM